MPARRKNLNRIVNMIPSKNTEDDWRAENALGAGILAAPATLPPSKDLREDWWKVGD